MATQISAHNITKSFPHRLVLHDVTCTFDVGRRTGIIGENGSGKTTLLRLLAGIDKPDAGQVTITADGGVGYLAQDVTVPPNWTVREVIDHALRDLRVMESRMRHLEKTMADGDERDLAEYGRLLTAFELRGGYEADARVERTLHGLGLGRITRDRTVGSLSGGEQIRLQLASTLAATPEVLLLDEPTNHLDDNALTWLEEHLRSRRGTTVAVSHDRIFLDRVTTTLIEVDADRRSITRYGNGYSGYLAEKAAAHQRWVREFQQWQDNIAQMREFVATTAHCVAPGRAMKDNNKLAYGRYANRVQHSVASRIRTGEEKLRRLLANPVPQPPAPLRFTPPLHASTARGVVVDAAGVSVTQQLAATTLTIKSGDRLLITGRNGIGKTTLLRVLAGELAPSTGEITRNGRIGYLPQEVQVTNPALTVLAAFAWGKAGSADEHAEKLISLGLFSSDQLSVSVGTLSTGQQQRLALARLLTEPADVLLLDEPTNHLSLALVEEVEAGLELFSGAVVLVSHDRRLRQRWNGAHREL